MMIYAKDMINYQDHLYLIVLSMPLPRNVDSLPIEEIKQKLGADIVVTSGPTLYFCRQIPEAEFTVLEDPIEIESDIKQLPPAKVD